MNTTCPVCANEVPPYYYEHPNGARIGCLVCGTYRLMEQAHQRLVEERIVRGGVVIPNLRLSGALRQRAEQGEEPVLSDPATTEREYQFAGDPLESVDRILSHLHAKAPSGHVFVPLVGHRDFAVGGADGPEAFDFALSQAVELGFITRKAANEAAYRIAPVGWKHLRSLGTQRRAVRRVFLSHAAADHRLAELVRTHLVGAGRDVTVFAASRAGDIRADEDWLPVIQRELLNADAYCVLLTRNSTNRPWVWFETGAAWMSGKKWVIARAGDLQATDVPLPLSVRQTYALDDPGGAGEIFRALEVNLLDPNAFVAEVLSLAPV